jgi:hypothetical protein
MVEKSQLKNLLARQAYSRHDKILICLACGVNQPKNVKNIRELAVSSGLRLASKWNISQILSSKPELAIRVPQGWELTQAGKKRVSELVGPLAASPTPVIASTLRQHIPNLSTDDTKRFVEEAVECFESRKFRAAVVLSWVGAVSVLHHHVVSYHLPAFNAEALRRDAKWTNAKNTDDLARMKEADFLDVLVALSIIGKNVKQELEGCLRLRNGCGHPSSLKIGEARVSAHIELLILNVFAIFT